MCQKVTDTILDAEPIKSIIEYMHAMGMAELCRTKTDVLVGTGYRGEKISLRIVPTKPGKQWHRWYVDHRPVKKVALIARFS